jgi:acetoin utilization protein AcuC
MNSTRIRKFYESAEEAGLFSEGECVKVPPRAATIEEVERFHHKEHVAYVREASASGEGFLDQGDTPAYKGIFEASLYAVGSTLAVLDRVIAGEDRHGFNPMGGLHHARRDRSAGFCVFNDVGVAIETARTKYKLSPILYVDIDVHHGDGVFYSYEGDPHLFIGDIHEDGRFLYPGTGMEDETGVGAAVGTKLNIALKPGATDRAFVSAFDRVLEFANRAAPQLVIMQCGADCLADDPLAHLHLTPASHEYAAAKLAELSHRHAEGRMIALGGGGYNPTGAAQAWIRVVKTLARHSP